MYQKTAISKKMANIYLVYNLKDYSSDIVRYVTCFYALHVCNMTKPWMTEFRLKHGYFVCYFIITTICEK